MKRSLIAVVALSLCASLCAAEEQPCVSLKQAAAEWTCLVGEGQAPDTGKTVVIGTDAQWKAFWKGRAEGALPSVDFSREVVVAALSDSSAKSYKVFRLSKSSPSVAAYAAGRKNAAHDMTAAQGRIDGVLSADLFPALKDSVADARVQTMGSFGAFDAAAGRDLRPAVGWHLQKVDQPGCTPGVDCPEPQQPQQGGGRKKPNCTPGVDCPEPPRQGGRQPNCTPGVDCPGDGRGNGGHETPLPPNYRPRPQGAPRNFPSRGTPEYYDRSADVAGYWHTYTDFLGRAEEEAGSWKRGTAEAVVERGGSEVGTQGTAYTATLRSRSSRNVYRLYWRYVGYNCDPNDSSQCLEWRIQYAWFYDREEAGQTRVMDVSVRFEQDKPMLPWQKERLVLSYDGNQIGLDRSGAAFEYSVRGPLVDQQRGVATLELTAGNPILRQPEADKVSLSLVNQNGRLQLVLDDRRDSFYEGEPLEISVEVKKDSGSFWKGDKVVFQRAKNGALQFVIKAGQHPQATLDVPNLGSGKYYIKSWSFRRAQSKISSGYWIDLGKGNTVQY